MHKHKDTSVGDAGWRLELSFDTSFCVSSVFWFVYFPLCVWLGRKPPRKICGGWGNHGVEKPRCCLVRGHQPRACPQVSGHSNPSLRESCCPLLDQLQILQNPTNFHNSTTNHTKSLMMATNCCQMSQDVAIGL